MSRLCEQRGTTLIELLIAMTMMLMVTGATLMVFDALQDNGRRNQQVNDAQDQARTAVDRLARELRNLASPSVLTDAATIQPLAVEKAEPFDLVFLTVGETKDDVPGNLNDANIRRVRYCLDAADPDRGVLRMQWQTWTDRASAPQPAPPTTACPSSDAGWVGDMAVAENLVNRSGGRNIALFLYDNTILERITRIRTRAVVDPTPGTAPAEVALASGVVLRNQNRVPIADFSVSNGTAVGTLILNGSASTDPENQRLNYEWKVDGVVRTECLAESITCITSPLTRGVDHTISLTVRDPADLRGEAEKTWRVP